MKGSLGLCTRKWSLGLWTRNVVKDYKFEMKFRFMNLKWSLGLWTRNDVKVYKFQMKFRFIN